LLALLAITLILPSVAVFADVPSVISIIRRTENGKTIIDVKVSHSNPSSSHFISQINIDLDGVSKIFTDLPKATTSEATFSLDIGTANPKTIKAQAVCNLHGPGSFFVEGASTGGSGGGGIPSYPIEGTFVGILLALTILLIIKRVK
jgi:desulfoferrodoxin (superoxide reductase-like protein)